MFTNGCFDLLHLGHITLLEQARRMGDRLIVALNSDRSVRALKGRERPLVREDDRARIVAALAAVDAVVVFDEDTPLRLVEALRPDVMVKGGDYTEAEVVGAGEVRGWGGRLELVPLVTGCSTTGLIERSDLAGHFPAKVSGATASCSQGFCRVAQHYCLSPGPVGRPGSDDAALP